MLSNTDWVLFAKRNNMKPVVVLDVDVFFDLLKLIPNKKKGR